MTFIASNENVVCMSSREMQSAVDMWRKWRHDDFSSGLLGRRTLCSSVKHRLCIVYRCRVTQEYLCQLRGANKEMLEGSHRQVFWCVWICACVNERSADDLFCPSLASAGDDSIAAKRLSKLGAEHAKAGVYIPYEAWSAIQRHEHRYKNANRTINNTDT